MKDVRYREFKVLAQDHKLVSGEEGLSFRLFSRSEERHVLGGDIAQGSKPRTSEMIYQQEQCMENYCACA